MAAARRKPASLPEIDEHLYARLPDGREVCADSLSSDDVLAVRAASKQSQLTCVVCGERMVPKLGEVMRWHFAHHPDCEFPNHEPESDPHKQGKTVLERWGRALWPDGECRQEWRLPQIRQIADVLTTRPGQRPIALEIQYADLSAQRWRERHFGYASIGVDDLWVLGQTRARLHGKKEATLDALCSAMLAAQHPVIYLNPRSRYVTWVKPQAHDLFRAAAGQRLGRVPVTVVRCSIDRLRVDGAHVFLADDPDPGQDEST